jgi:prepilin-type N-terminal cleavage/methylation domain-containing protein
MLPPWPRTPLVRFSAAVARRLRALREDGFSMIEMVTAMALFAIVITPLGGVMTATLSAQAGSKERTLAQQAAQAAVEEIRGMPYDDVGLTNWNPAGRLSGSRRISL